MILFKLQCFLVKMFFLISLYTDIKRLSMTFYLTACDRHPVNTACPLPPFVSVLFRFHCITSSIHYLLFLSDSTPENFTNIWQNEGVLCRYPEAPATEKKRRGKVTLSVIFFFHLLWALSQTLIPSYIDSSNNVNGSSPYFLVNNF